MNQHTPGPWTVETWNYQDRGKRLVVQSASDAICEMLPLYRPKAGDMATMEAEPAANARLIAQAPAMLGLLRAYLATINGGLGEMADIDERARTILRAVEGE